MNTDFAAAANFAQLHCALVEADLLPCAHAVQEVHLILEGGDERSREVNSY